MDPAPDPATFALPSKPAIRYNEPPEATPHTVLDDAVAAVTGEAARRAGLHVPVADARLSRVCADLAELVPEEEGIHGVTLDDSIVEFALQRNGIIEPAVQLLFGWGNADVPGQFVKELQPKLVEILGDKAAARFGVGVARPRPDGTSAIVFALQGSGVSTLPIPRTVAPDGNVVVDAILEPRFHDPEVFVTYERGDTRQVELRPGRPGGFIAQLTCSAHKGRHQMEIIASDASGSTVLANFPVWCATEPPSSFTLDPVAGEVAVDGPAQAEQHLLASINRDRATAGLPILLWDDAVAVVARRYSEEMRRTRVIAHISPTSGAVTDRVRAANITTRVVLENIARAWGLDEAHRSLMNSPGHRANIMSTMATHIGIGVALGDESSGRRELFITQVFTQAFTRVPPAPVPESGDRAGIRGRVAR